ncbi:phage tail protein [Pseudomonas sp. MS-1(2024)]|uniref:gp53-like domain-containing protein n=1 Tax=Pseudomonas sp. MS-1(2024) TaxID=3112251 RepID=UPI002DBDDC6E|nr:phage tail protein [Pseudomonas sp. MS-1(2024)]MEC4168291.1 phage tail protein [Pseudomonas sp. MS-1(2024)]
MQRISSWTDLVAAFGLFRYGTVTGGVAPTPLKAEWLNMVQEELANFILAYLPALDKDDNTQLLKAIQAFGSAYPLKSTTLAGYGIVDAYTKPEADGLLSKKANNAITLAGYGIGDAYTKLVIDAALADKQAAIGNLAATKQDKNTALMAANGWRLDKATGLLEQWGNGYCPPDAATAAINFPTPFAEVYNCFGNKVTPNSQDGDGNAAGALAISATQYQLFNDTVAYGATIHWRAIGRAPGY